MTLARKKLQNFENSEILNLSGLYELSAGEKKRLGQAAKMWTNTNLRFGCIVFSAVKFPGGTSLDFSVTSRPSCLVKGALGHLIWKEQRQI